MAATRFYFPASGTAGASPTVSADWGHNNAVRRPCSPTKANTALAATSYAPDGADDIAANDSMFVQFVSAPLLEQILTAQAVKWQFQCLEDHTNNNLFLTVKIFLCTRAGTVRDTLLAQKVDGTEIAITTLTNRGDSSTTTQVIADVGDRLVFEIGMGGTPVATSGVQGHNGQIRFGDNQASDLPEDDASTSTTLNPWLEFANEIKFSRENSVTENFKSIRVGNGMSTTERVR